MEQRLQLELAQGAGRDERRLHPDLRAGRRAAADLRPLDDGQSLAHLSSRGVHRIIKDSGHHVQLDRPQAVIDAVDEVLCELRTGPKS